MQIQNKQDNLYDFRSLNTIKKVSFTSYIILNLKLTVIITQPLGVHSILGQLLTKCHTFLMILNREIED